MRVKAITVEFSISKESRDDTIKYETKNSKVDSKELMTALASFLLFTSSNMVTQ